ncbi:MAG: CRISPR-associated endonuclease Cas1 [Exilispira sp.]
MPVVYIISNYGRLSKKGDTLLFEGKDYNSTIFPFRTEGIVFIGKVDITAAALSLLMKHQIDTVFLSTNGRFNGKLTFSEKKNVFLRLKQYKLLENNDARISFAKQIVFAKLKNEITYLNRMNRKNKYDSEIISSAINRIKSFFTDIENAKDIQKLRGYEGIAAREYFSVFGKDLIHEWAIFKGRSRNPPKDNVNAVLSFLYTLLYQRVDAAIESEDLDPYIGMFHELDYGKRTLSFDLMEEFRTPIVDTTTISLFNLSILDKDDFREVDFSADNDENFLEDISKFHEEAEVSQSESNIEERYSKSLRGVLLNENGLKKVIEYFEKKMATTLISPSSGNTVSYAGLIREQVKMYKRFVNSEEIVYKPFTYR